ncbi:MAG: hypothetical protein EXR62_15630 [Chloroflexi bacterium]|nr:hypothetical protein [Chloroflexota bacterium]
MPKALFFNVPGHGHVNPSLPLVAELSRRGHHITYFVTENYRAQVEAAGAVFQPYAAVGADYFDARGLHGGVPLKVALNLIMTTEQILPELLATARAAHPDYILFDGMCPWGYFVARILRVPAVASLALMPPISPPLRAMLSSPLLRTFMPALLRDFGKGLEANRRSRALGKKHNVLPLGPTSLLNAPGDLAISYTSSYFQPFASTLPDTVQLVGWTLSEASANVPFPLPPMPERRLIYVSLGTLNNDNAPFFSMCLEAFAGAAAFVIMSTENRISPDAFGKLPENISIHGWVPQTEVLKRAALFVTHGGLTSVHDGLYCGVPLLLVPQQEEQTFNALRVVELGAGLMLKKAQVNATAIRTTAAQLLTDTRFKSEAHRIGDSFRSAGGVTRAAAEIEALLRQQR